MVIKCRINGVDVVITEVDTKWERVYFALNGHELFEWFESDFSELGKSYKLVSSKYEFIKENGEYFRNHFVIIKDNNEYIDFLNRLYDFLQDHLKNCGKGQNEMARVEDRELLYKYAIWILRKEHLKALFDSGYLYDADFEDVDKNIAKLENLILRRMSR